MIKEMMMRKLIVLLTLLLMSSTAFAMSYYLQRQRTINGVTHCYYGGGHVLTVTGLGRCPRKIERGL
jgi:hydrogenase/urease accessory protein HupE